MSNQVLDVPREPHTPKQLLDGEIPSIKELLGDLFEPRPLVYWIDFTVCAGLGWLGFVACWYAAANREIGLAIAGGCVAVFSQYRAMMFAHELSHIKTDRLPGFRVGWNLMFGAPILAPSALYEGMHLDHHRAATYGTAQDPEYECFVSEPQKIGYFMLFAFLLPIGLLLRGLVVAPLSWFVPPLRRIVIERFSSFSFNPHYRRRMAREELAALFRWELVGFLTWISAFVLVPFAAIDLILTYYLVVLGVALANNVRTLGSHRYESRGNHMGMSEQVLDSIDTVDGWWAALWFPVGLRFHALHHFIPSLPYHNLPEANARIVNRLGPAALFRLTQSPNIQQSLLDLARRVDQAKDLES